MVFVSTVRVLINSRVYNHSNSAKQQRNIQEALHLCTSLKLNKRSVLRRQSRDTNRNIKRSVYCQYMDSIV